MEIAMHIYITLYKLHFRSYVGILFNGGARWGYHLESCLRGLQKPWRSSSPVSRALRREAEMMPCS